MDNDRTSETQGGVEKMLYNEHYYKYVFKKTEKIVSAVFFILEKIKDNRGHSEQVHLQTSVSATSVLNLALRSLQAPPYRADEALEELLFALIDLESRIRLLQSLQLISDEVSSVLVAEIGGVMRNLNQHINIRPALDLTEFDTAVSGREGGTRRPRAHAGAREGAAISRSLGARSTSRDRRTRILEVLGDKGQTSIKDISDVITDCSQKTIQRELNSMIDDGIVLKEGQRRWSKYRLSSGTE